MSNSQESSGRQEAATLRSRLRLAEPTLTANDRAIAALLRHDPLLVAFQTVEEVAHRAGVSKAAIVRFATRLGYRGFSELRADLRRRMHERVGSRLQKSTDAAPVGSTTGAGDVRSLLSYRLAQDIASISRFVDLVYEQDLLRCVDLLAEPRARVYVVGQRRAYAVAMHAYRQLSWIRPNVRFFHTEELGLQVALHDIRPEDIVLVFAFRRYARVSELVLRRAAEVDAKAILVTDDPACSFVGLADHVLVCPVTNESPFDSTVPAVFCADSLFALVIQRIGEDKVIEHVRQIQSHSDAVELESADGIIAPARGNASRAKARLAVLRVEPTEAASMPNVRP